MNEELELAKRYVEQTGVSIFLTGKAGTGKTTFLRDIDAHCAKRHVVVAPTGVAAVNAGGVTIHSFFQLPFDPYLPDVKELVTEYQMPDSFKSLNKTKVDIIKTLELLIIDEISMVRADLLDAIDMTLRRYRRSSRPFGGVQLLMIGDVHQLPPVVTEQEKEYMKRVYRSPFFFESKALQQLTYVTIELTTVYRQQDSAFVELLNHVRDNRMDSATLAALNNRVESRKCKVESGKWKAEGAIPITLTTHNYQADAINRRQMEALSGESRTMKGRVDGEYPEIMFPVAEMLELKEGERVMFVKNDSSGAHRYYNGKLGTVAGFIDDDDDGTLVMVQCDDGNDVEVGMEKWENIKYVIDSKDGSIAQTIDGTYSQYPLRAAWAVTIHKAQGLTFDKVTIDAADAFAAGQVYVALSRCRSLEGLTLSTPLNAGSAFGDSVVQQFCSQQPSFAQIKEVVPQFENQYYFEQLADLFSFNAIRVDFDKLAESYSKVRNIFPSNYEAMLALRDTVEELASVGERFCNQLLRLPREQHEERVAKATEYFLGKIKPLLAAVDALLDVEIDNRENSKLIKEAGEVFTRRLKLKKVCMEVVEKEGFSVATVQQTKAQFELGKTNGKRRAENGKRNGVPSARPTTENGELRSRRSDLEEQLRRWRKEKAEEQGVPIHFVMQQKTLSALLKALPTTEKELLDVPGIGRAKVAMYGRELLEIINNKPQ